MKGKHLQKRNRSQTLRKALKCTIIVMMIVCTMLVIPAVRDLKNLEEEVKELKTSVLNLEKQQEEPQTSPAPKADEVTESQYSDVQEPTEQAYTVTVEELQTLAKIVYQEARGIPQKSHQAAVIWCILNRVDDGYWGDDIITVATYPYAFAWVPNTPVEDEFMDLAMDVVTRWNREKQGFQDVGRTLPDTYLYFTGDGQFNYFTEEWKDIECWDWSLPDPYLS